MIYLWASLVVILNGFWLLLVLLMLPGNWLMVATTAAVAWWQWDRGMFSAWTLVVIVLLAVLGEVVEFFGSARGVSRAGGSRRGSLGALLGGLPGGLAGTVLIPVPILGTLLGVCVGACVGAMVLELTRDPSKRRAGRLGLAAAKGAVTGTMLKFLIGVVIWGVVAVAAFAG